MTSSDAESEISTVASISKFTFVFPRLIWKTLPPIVAKIILMMFKVMSPGSSARLSSSRNLLSRARIKTTNLSLSVIVAFIVTNLPYIIDEFIRQDIFTGGKCTQYPWCHVVKVCRFFLEINCMCIYPWNISPCSSQLHKNS